LANGEADGDEIVAPFPVSIIGISVVTLMTRDISILIADTVCGEVGCAEMC
jgi:hypothetical protein